MIDITSLFCVPSYSEIKQERRNKRVNDMKKKLSPFMQRLKYFSPIDRYNDNHTQETYEDREWENAYRKRWQHDKVIRSTHGVNCTGSCSWNIYVKDGIVTWEGQELNYPS